MSPNAGGGGLAGSQPMSIALHIELTPYLPQAFKEILKRHSMLLEKFLEIVTILNF
jgi:hypothetical protein